MEKIIIVTGASSGLGECFSRQLANENSIEKCSQLWLIARRTDRLETLKNELNQINSGLKIKCFSLDLTGVQGAQSFNQLLEQEKEQGEFEIQILVNNAGFGTYGEFANTSVERQMEMIDLNCTSLTGITGYALPYMKEGSRIINTASLAGYGPLGNFAVYGASKAYVLSFTVALAAELKQRKIKVTALCPGSVSTEFANVASRGARKEVLHGKDPVKVVRDAIKKSRKGKMISMPILKWKFNAFLCTVLPKSFIAWGTFTFNKRPSN